MAGISPSACYTVKHGNYSLAYSVWSESALIVQFDLLAVFCGWLLPLAWLAKIHPDYAFLLVILAYLPLLLGMAKTRPFA